MNMTVLLIGIVAAVALALLWPRAIAAVVKPMAAIIASDDEVNACAQQIALADMYKGNIEAFLVDTPNANLIAQAKAYSWTAAETVMAKWVRQGREMCLRLKLTGQPIPKLITQVRPGYHITRSNGSAMLVKDGDPEPVFGCMEGYHPNSNGDGCVK